MSDKDKFEKIVGVAMILHEDDSLHALPAPLRHHDIIRFLAERGYRKPIAGEQGFITDKNRFVRRIVARVMAIDSGQVKIENGRAKTIHGSELFSEDLW